MTDDPLRICEKCGGDLRKIINSVGIVFKGSGFYHTDSKSKDNSAMHAQPSSHDHSASDSGTTKGGSGSSEGASAPAADSSASATTKAAVSAPGRQA